MFAFSIPVFYTMLQIFFFLSLGFFLRKYQIFNEGFFSALGSFVIKVCVPLYFITRMSQFDLADLARSVRFPVLAILLSVAGVSIGWTAFTILRFSREDKTAGIALSGFGNAGYLPISIIELMPLSLPMIEQLFSTQLALFYVGAFLFAFSPMLWSFGQLFIQGGSLKNLHRGLISPAMIGIVIGVSLSALGLGPMLSEAGNPLSAIFPAMKRVADMMIPSVLIVLGAMAGELQFDRQNLRSLLRLTSVVALIRFGAMPLLFFLLAPFVWLKASWTPTELWVVFLQFSTPPSTNLSLMAAESGINKDHATFTLLVCYILFLLIFPLYLTWFMHTFGFLAVFSAAGA